MLIVEAGNQYLGGCSYESERDLWDTMSLDYDLYGEARDEAAKKIREQIPHHATPAARRVFDRLYADLERSDEMKRLLAKQKRAEKVSAMHPEWAMRELVQIDEALEKLR